MASSSSSRTRSSLTDDILILIFTYLPLSSIYKFKCLSKVWLSNLSNPNFITKWFKINSKSLPWIHYHAISDDMYDYDCEDPLKFKMAYPESHREFMSRNRHSFSFEFLVKQKPFRGASLYLLGSSNGLVLCHSWSNAQGKYHVCNPLTQKWVTLPEPPRSRVRGFDTCGIFSDASCYKVVHIPRFSTPSKKFYVDVFSSDLGAWESFQVSCCDGNVVQGDPSCNNVVIHNSVLFWIVRSKRMVVYNLSQKNGSDGHQCISISLPDMEFDDDEIGYTDSVIGESEGWVWFVKTRVTSRGMSVSVWVLNEVNWQILHNHISLDDILAEVRSGTGEVARINVLGFSQIDRNVVLLGCKHLVWGINIQTRSLEELCLDNLHVYDVGSMFVPFVLKPMPTLLPPPSWIDTN